MKIHVLPGDALTEKFTETKIEGEAVICRECLVEGDLKAENLPDFWRVRANFICSTYGEAEDKYYAEVVGELEKLRDLSPATEAVNLWFEYELFCQVNMWFCLSLLEDKAAAIEINRVAPVTRSEDEIWKGFGKLSAGDLQKCFDGKIRFTGEEIALGANLWRAYQAADFKKLEELGRAESPCFPRLEEVTRAAVEKNFQPQKILRDITENGAIDFAKEVFPKFSRRAGVYGFGDAQVRRIWQQL